MSDLAALGFATFDPTIDETYDTPSIEHDFRHFWGDAHTVLGDRFFADVLRLDASG
jgi:hypothetical protein